MAIDVNLRMNNPVSEARDAAQQALLAAQAAQQAAINAANNAATLADNRIPTSDKGAAYGVATLGSDQKLVSNQVPDNLVTKTYLSGELAGKSNVNHTHQDYQDAINTINVSTIPTLENKVTANTTAIAGLSNLGHFVGTFNTKATVPTSTASFPNGITVNDFINVRADETQSNATTRYIATAIAGTTITWAYDMSYSMDVSGKADIVASAVNGHLAGLNASGNLTDSGIVGNDVATKTYVDSAVGGIVIPPSSSGVNQQANLASTTAANSISSATIGVTGVLPIANGGTGQTIGDVVYGTVATAAGTAAKVGTLAGFVRRTGSIVGLSFTNATTVSPTTLDVNSTGAATMRYKNANLLAEHLSTNAGYVAYFQFDGSYWQLLNPATAMFIKATSEADAKTKSATAGQTTNFYWWS